MVRIYGVLELNLVISCRVYKNYQALGIAHFSYKDWPLQDPDHLQFLKLTRRSFPCRYQVSGCGG